jgi:hypothetical protein
MKKLIAALLAAAILALSCASQNNLSEAEQEKYRKARQRYEAGQKGGP